MIPAYAQVGAQRAVPLQLPHPGVRVSISPEFAPVTLKGVKINPDNPFAFDFVIDRGDSNLDGDALKTEGNKLIKYFLASLTTPEADMWVNLSPYEQDRIIPDSFGTTEMGRDLLAEDYLLKQITASIIYPEDDLGKKFWGRVYKEAYEKYGTTDVPVNTFNKVWVVPDKAVVYEHDQTAFVTETHMKVMLEEDYLALEHSKGDGRWEMGDNTNTQHQSPNTADSSTAEKDINRLGSQIVREIVIPALEEEVNNGKNFVQLRQVYSSLILATWYKRKLKGSILSQMYIDQKKTKGIEITRDVGRGTWDEKAAEAGSSSNVPRPTSDVTPEDIYQQYLAAFKKGVYNYIKEDFDPVTNEVVPRKYFSGGMELLKVDQAMMVTTDRAMLNDAVQKSGSLQSLSVILKGIESPGAPDDNIMLVEKFNARIEAVARSEEFLASSVKTAIGAGLGMDPRTPQPARDRAMLGAFDISKVNTEYLAASRVVGYTGIHTVKVEGPEKEIYHAKTYGDPHSLRTEYASFRLARALGVHVPEVKLIEDEGAQALQGFNTSYHFPPEAILVLQPAEEYDSASASARSGLEEFIVFVYLTNHRDYVLPDHNVLRNAKGEFVAYDLPSEFALNSETAETKFKLSGFLPLADQIDISNLVKKIREIESMSLNRFKSELKVLGDEAGDAMLALKGNQRQLRRTLIEEIETISDWDELNAKDRELLKKHAPKLFELKKALENMPGRRDSAMLAAERKDAFLETLENITAQPGLMRDNQDGTSDGTAFEGMSLDLRETESIYLAHYEDLDGTSEAGSLYQLEEPLRYSAAVLLYLGLYFWESVETDDGKLFATKETTDALQDFLNDVNKILGQDAPFLDVPLLLHLSLAAQTKPSDTGLLERFSKREVFERIEDKDLVDRMVALDALLMSFHINADFQPMGVDEPDMVAIEQEIVYLSGRLKQDISEDNRRRISTALASLLLAFGNVSEEISQMSPDNDQLRGIKEALNGLGRGEVDRLIDELIAADRVAAYPVSAQAFTFALGFWGFNSPSGIRPTDVLLDFNSPVSQEIFRSNKLISQNLAGNKVFFDTVVNEAKGFYASWLSADDKRNADSAMLSGDSSRRDFLANMAKIAALTAFAPGVLGQERPAVSLDTPRRNYPLTLKGFEELLRDKSVGIHYYSHREWFETWGLDGKIPDSDGKAVHGDDGIAIHLKTAQKNSPYLPMLAHEAIHALHYLEDDAARLVGDLLLVRKALQADNDIKTLALFDEMVKVLHEGYNSVAAVLSDYTAKRISAEAAEKEIMAFYMPGMVPGKLAFKAKVQDDGFRREVQAVIARDLFSRILNPADTTAIITKEEALQKVLEQKRAEEGGFIVGASKQISDMTAEEIEAWRKRSFASPRSVATEFFSYVYQQATPKEGFVSAVRSPSQPDNPNVGRLYEVLNEFMRALPKLKNTREILRNHFNRLEAPVPDAFADRAMLTDGTREKREVKVLQRKAGEELRQQYPDLIKRLQSMLEQAAGDPVALRRLIDKEKKFKDFRVFERKMSGVIYLAARNFVARVHYKEGVEDDLYTDSLPKGITAKDVLIRSGENIDVFVMPQQFRWQFPFLRSDSDRGLLWDIVLFREGGSEDILLEAIKNIEQRTGLKFDTRHVQRLAAFAEDTVAETEQSLGRLVKEYMEMDWRERSIDYVRAHQFHDPIIHEVEAPLKVFLSQWRMMMPPMRAAFMHTDGFEMKYGTELGVTVRGFNLIGFPMSIGVFYLQPTYAHEAIQSSSFGFEAPVLDEGMTEYLTIKFMMSFDGFKGSMDDYLRNGGRRFVYSEHVAAVRKIMAVVGEEAMVNAYLHDDYDGIADSPLTYGGFNRLSGFLRQYDDRRLETQASYYFPERGFLPKVESFLKKYRGQKPDQAMMAQDRIPKWPENEPSIDSRVNNTALPRFMSIGRKLSLLSQSLRQNDSANVEEQKEAILTLFKDFSAEIGAAEAYQAVYERFSDRLKAANEDDFMNFLREASFAINTTILASKGWLIDIYHTPSYDFAFRMAKVNKFNVVQDVDGEKFLVAVLDDWSGNDLWVPSGMRAMFHDPGYLLFSYKDFGNPQAARAKYNQARWEGSDDTLVQDYQFAKTMYERSHDMSFEVLSSADQRLALMEEWLHYVDRKRLLKALEVDDGLDNAQRVQVILQEEPDNVIKADIEKYLVDELSYLTTRHVVVATAMEVRANLRKLLYAQSPQDLQQALNLAARGSAILKSGLLNQTMPEDVYGPNAYSAQLVLSAMEQVLQGKQLDLSKSLKIFDFPQLMQLSAEQIWQRLKTVTGRAMVGDVEQREDGGEKIKDGQDQAMLTANPLRQVAETVILTHPVSDARQIELYNRFMRGMPQKIVLFNEAYPVPQLLDGEQMNSQQSMFGEFNVPQGVLGSAVFLGGECSACLSQSIEVTAQAAFKESKDFTAYLPAEGVWVWQDSASGRRASLQEAIQQTRSGIYKYSRFDSSQYPSEDRIKEFFNSFFTDMIKSGKNQLLPDGTSIEVFFEGQNIPIYKSATQEYRLVIKVLSEQDLGAMEQYTKDIPDRAMLGDVKRAILQSNLLDREAVEYSLAIGRVVNPNDKPFTIAYGAAGADVSTAILVTRFTTAYWINRYWLQTDDLEKAKSEWDVDKPKRKEYFQQKFNQGYSDANLVDQDIAYFLMQELKALGVERTSVKIGIDQETDEPSITFRLNSRDVERKIIFIDQNLKLLSAQEGGAITHLRGRLDAYYERSSQDLLSSHPDNVGIYTQWLKPRGILLLNNWPIFSRAPEIDIYKHLPKGFKEIFKGTAVEKLNKTLISQRNAYGHVIGGWQKPDQAMMGVDDKVGGIDFNADKINLEVNSDGAPIEFHFDPKEFESMKVDGFIPVILDMKPITDLPLYIGLSVEEEPVQVTQLKRDRHCERLKGAKQSQVLGLLRRFAPRNDVVSVEV